MANPGGRKLLLYFGGFVSLTTSGYFAFNTIRMGNTHKYGDLNVVRTGEEPDLESIFDDNANEYDSKINNSENVMGVKLMRRYLVGKARGTVLEVGGGTARNLKYYNPEVVSEVCIVDFSARMLVRAHQKALELAESNDKIMVRPLTVTNPRVLAELATEGGDTTSVSAESALTETGPGLMEITTHQMDVMKLDFPDNHFDTVIDTFGLCSFADPVKVLKEMQRVCKNDGVLLLLEHGRSEKWETVSNLLDNGALQHYQNWGCWWNRNMIELAVRAGLPLNSLKTFHFGTTYMFECPPKPVDRSSKITFLKKNTIPTSTDTPNAVSIGNDGNGNIVDQPLASVRSVPRQKLSFSKPVSRKKPELEAK